MSREKRIKEIETIAKTLCADFQTEKCYECPANKHCEVGLDACVIYDAGYRKQSEDVTDINVGNKAEWISVSERLPEEAGRAYLVWDNVQANVKKRFFYRIPLNMPVETYPYIREYFGNVSDYKRYTHWMPLPEPPKGD